MAIEHRMDGADRGRMDIGIKPPQPLTDLLRSPGGLVLLEALAAIPGRLWTEALKDKIDEGP